jgi:hypothetical protein
VVAREKGEMEGRRQEGALEKEKMARQFGLRYHVKNSVDTIVKYFLWINEMCGLGLLPAINYQK